jgi:hypothetical protein
MIEFMASLERELAGWQADFEPDYPGELSTPMMDGEREARISQMKIVLNSCEAGDMRRAIAKRKRLERKLAA